MKTFIINGEEIKIPEIKNDGKTVSFTLDGQHFSFETITSANGEIILQDSQGDRFKSYATKPNREGVVQLITSGVEGSVSEGGKKLKKSGGAAGSLTSPMPGKIFKVLVSEGEKVTKGQTLLILEAMKMEHTIKASKDGKIKEIIFKVGDQVQNGSELVRLD